MFGMTLDDLTIDTLDDPGALLVLRGNHPGLLRPSSPVLLFFEHSPLGEVLFDPPQVEMSNVIRFPPWRGHFGHVRAVVNEYATILIPPPSPVLDPIQKLSALFLDMRNETGVWHALLWLSRQPLSSEDTERAKSLLRWVGTGGTVDAKEVIRLCRRATKQAGA